MLKKKFILAGTVLFMFGLATSSFAQKKSMGHSGGSRHKHNSSDSMAQDSQKKAVEVSNKICPVLNEKIDEKVKATYEYKGKIYNFCCAACIEDFKKDPEKYIKKIKNPETKEKKPQG